MEHVAPPSPVGRATSPPVVGETDALVIHDAGDLRLDRVAVAVPASNQVLVRMRWGGICGSDLHYLRHGGVGASVLRQPMVLGHEVCGTVAAVGSTTTRWTVGDPVAIHPARPCGRCPECARGLHNLCRDTRFLGSAAFLPHTDGGFRGEMVVDADQLHALPPGLDLRVAVLAEPLAVALHALRRAGGCLGRSVLVQGAGPIGALLVAAAASAGAVRVVATDVKALPLRLARRLGAQDTWNAANPDAGGDEEFDLVFEATGVAAALDPAVSRTRKGGILVQVGMFPPGPVAAPLSRIVARELDFRGSFRFDTEFADALALLARRPEIAEHLVTHTRPLAAFDEAFALCADREQAGKVLLDFGTSP